MYAKNHNSSRSYPINQTLLQCKSRKNWRRGQYFTTIDETELDILKASCREYTLLRSDQLSHMKGLIRGDTKIGPVLEVAVVHHEGRYGAEI